MFSFYYYVFLYPNASHNSIQWFSDILDAKWEIFLLALLVMDLIVLGCYYFLTKPSKTAMIRFWILTILLIIGGTLIGYFNLYSDRNTLLMEGKSWTYEHTLVSIVSSLISSFEMILIVIVFFLVLSLLPASWQLRAMRRYPFKKIP